LCATYIEKVAEESSNNYSSEDQISDYLEQRNYNITEYTFLPNGELYIFGEPIMQEGEKEEKTSVPVITKERGIEILFDILPCNASILTISLYDAAN
jgi:hypothetical protein